ncbi:uncharacterized protein JCM10292_007586 [Rhodotorula paludigena]|uniref:uncharacterized protein n=1 Tax=Rhodotorula paludigena TaxID=86838 RepID=UPI0031761633
MAKSASAKGKQPQPARAPSPAPSASSSSASPSSASSSASDSSDSDSDRSSSASPAPELPKQPVRVVDPNLRKYHPPSGFTALKANVAQGALDWDTVKDDADLELWAVRIPAGLKPKHLEGLELTLPPADLPTPSQPVGHFTIKKSEYDAHLSAGSAAGANKRRRDDGDSSATVDGAGELQAAVPLLPRKSHGNKLFQAPRPFARTLTLSRALPASVLSTAHTSHLVPSSTTHSSLIVSQPSPVPGAILSADELLDAREAARRKEAIRGKGARDQPHDLIRFRLGNLGGGSGVEGGKGRYHNPLPAVQVDLSEPVAAEEGAEDEDEDAKMAPPAAEQDEAQRKKEKKDKKEKRRKSEAGEGGPKKKKAKADE